MECAEFKYNRIKIRVYSFLSLKMDKTHRVIWILILHNFIKDISIKNIIQLRNTIDRFNPQGIYKSIDLIVLYIANGNSMYNVILPEIVVIFQS